ncbi:hypothetical protein JTE90_029647 [Oedothorax gibbosus]|uniref:Uncharacterized protein n=1 Tax=Oedothorax gibbosus TaxID=931172 RepID=A0AAV6VG63_9ARAC|nr:hypothetical protein JTE90_029647 [Oedothorax gibbosus]
MANPKPPQCPSLEVNPKHNRNPKLVAEEQNIKWREEKGGRHPHSTRSSRRGHLEFVVRLVLLGRARRSLKKTADVLF